MRWSVRCFLARHLFGRTNGWDAADDPTIRMLRAQRRSALLETRRLRRDRADLADLLMDARRRHDG